MYALKTTTIVPVAPGPYVWGDALLLPAKSVYWIVSNAVAMFMNPKCPVSVELFASGNKMSSVSFTDNSD